MIHDRHFTTAQANELLPEIEASLRSLRAARDRLTDSEAHEALSGAAPGNGGGSPGREVGEAFLEVRRLLGELLGAGLVIRDIDRGLVDFPAVIEGHEAYLCWQLNEPQVAFWHELESGFAGRRPLESISE